MSVVWEGRSLFDGRPIVAIATGLNSVSKNTKTGDMIQVWILPRWRSPLTALLSGSDESVCGDCPLRREACYVRVDAAPLSVWRAYQRGRYAPLEIDRLAGRRVRLGAYGDPAAIPVSAWVPLLEVCSGWTGYTHAWRTCDQRYREILMASCDTLEDRREARDRGWRTFRTRLEIEGLEAGEIACPASAEGGHRSTCAECGLCDGSRGESDRRRDIAIVAHGTTGKVRGYGRMRMRIIAE